MISIHSRLSALTALVASTVVGGLFGAPVPALADGLAHSYLSQRRVLGGERSATPRAGYRIQLFRPDGDSEATSYLPVAGNFNQKIDHTDPADARTFAQRYFIHSDYVTTSNAPVIYVMCGEGTCDDGEFRRVTSSYARTLGAHMVVLEHRYYGKSQPFANLASANLKYLSTEQALEDNAAFQRHAMAKLGLTGKWVAIGGSYSGNLAAYYRLKHPELVVGAIASSAPVRAKADFEEYDRHVATVAGPACANAMRAVTTEVEAALARSPAEHDQIKALFNSAGIRDDLDFLYVVADMAAAAVQYGMRDTFCNAITTAKPDQRVKAYAEAGVKALAVLQVTPEQDAFQFAESLDPADYELLGFGLRQWMYQSCTEYGYFQVSHHDPAVTVRSARIDLEYHRQVCERLFGIKTLAEDDVMNRGYYLPLLMPTTTQIFFSNGDNDPWSQLSLMPTLGNATNAGCDYAVIPGAAHCDDLRASGATAAVRAVQAQEFSRMQQWLK